MKLQIYFLIIASQFLIVAKVYLIIYSTFFVITVQKCMGGAATKKCQDISTGFEYAKSFWKVNHSESFLNAIEEILLFS